jgi:hypothetical protein
MSKLLSALLLFGFFTPLLYAKDGFKRYPVKSATILYDVNTTGESVGLKTNTIGVARLVFNEWGAHEIKEEDSTEVQIGDFNETRSRHTMSKIDFGTVYSIDYDEKIVYKTRDRDMDAAIAQGLDLSNENFAFLKDLHAIKTGTETIAGLTCDLWKGANQEVCLYQGIPLRISIEADGFRSSRTAVYAVIDKPIMESEFTVPSFPIIVDDDYTSNASALTRGEDYMAAVQDLHIALKGSTIDLSDTNATLTSEQENEVINILGKRYLEKQKRLLPKLKGELIKAKKCIADANNSRAAKSCMQGVNKVDEELGDKTENFIYDDWNETKKEKITQALDTEQKHLDVTIDCVSKNDKTTDVIKCTEGSLEASE